MDCEVWEMGGGRGRELGGFGGGLYVCRHGTRHSLLKTELDYGVWDMQVRKERQP